MSKQPKTLYIYKQVETLLIAFVGNLFLKLNNIPRLSGDVKIPVYLQETGDETYLNIRKFSNQENTYIGRTQDVYLSVPRCIIGIDELAFDSDQDTKMQFIATYLLPSNPNKYGHNHQITDPYYIMEGVFRRKAFTIPLTLNLVCSNFISMLEYQEIITSIFQQANNTFSYYFLGRNHQANFSQTSLNLEKNVMDMGGSKNQTLKIGVELRGNLQVPKYESLKKIGESLGARGNEGLYVEMDINSMNNDNTFFGQESGRDKNTHKTPVFDIESHLSKDEEITKTHTYFTKVDPREDND